MLIGLRFASATTLALLAGVTAVQAEETGAPPAAAASSTTAAPWDKTAAPAQPSPPTPEPAPVPATAAPTAPAASPPPGPAAASTRPFIILCQDGECAPYTRGCPRGLRFDGVRDCIPPGQLPADQAAAAAAREEEQKLALRLQNRRQPKFAISLDGMLGILGYSNSATALSLRLLVGYRGQIVPQAGLVVRGGVVGGIVVYDRSSDTTPAETASGSDSTGTVGGVIELAPYLGPFGRFYCGPLVFLGYFVHGKDTLRVGVDSLSLEKGTTAGLGLHGGVLLGDRERVALQFSVQGSGRNGFFLFTTVGVGFLY